MSEKTDPKFLICVDAVEKQLYVLHRGYPAFLAQVIQTIPHTLRIIDLYDDFDEKKLLNDPVMQKMKQWVKKCMEANIAGN